MEKIGKYKLYKSKKKQLKHTYHIKWTGGTIFMKTERNINESRCKAKMERGYEKEKERTRHTMYKNVLAHRRKITNDIT